MPDLTVLFWAAVLLAVVFACSESSDAPRQQTPPVQVQPRYQDARGFGGHALHVQQKKLPCESCHELSGRNFDKPGPERCARCHAPQAQIRHAAQTTAPDVGACTACHAFVASGQESAPPAWDCKRCHTGEHRRAGVPELVVHASAECRQCHSPHGDPPVRAAGCTTCHADVDSTHGTPAAAVTDDPEAVDNGCVVCHDAMHQRADQSERCSHCHQRAPARGPPPPGSAPIVNASATFAGGHQRCVDCHKPHAFGSTAAVACTNCHENLPTLGSSVAHNTCTNCHASHNARSSARFACSNCHAELSNDHPSVRGKSECTSCHAAHPRGVFAANTPGTRACSTCHEEAASERGFHGGNSECTGCHAPHHFKVQLTDDGACRNCHATQLAHVAETPGHARCRSCHTGLPHAVGDPARPCGDCHASQVGSAHRGHSDCASCHQSHSGALSADCGDCHRNQLASAPLGHQRCNACHETHSAERVANTSCQSCHQKQASAVHGRLATGCETCHRAHGPSGVSRPPSCRSCHEPSQLPALHGVEKHQNCGQCHGGHQKKVGPERPICASCHGNLERHFPDTQNCTGCHSFSRW